MKKKNRRQFIQKSLQTSFSLFVAAKLMNYEFIATAMANEELDKSFLEHKLINFTMNGGGSRWYWDLPLQPNGSSDHIIPNPMCITRYGQNITGLGEYRLTKLGDYYFPELWNTTLPSTSGDISMKELSNHMLSIRGIHLLNGGHTEGFKSQMQPEPGQSLMGVLADVSNLQFPAIDMGASSHYVSKRGTPLVSGGVTAFKAFNPSWYETPGGALSVNNANLEKGIDEALIALRDSMKSKHRYIPSSFQQRLVAKKLMKREYAGLSDTFSALEDKYENLMKLAFHDPKYVAAGVEDRAVPGDGSAYYRMGEIFYKGSDLRECFDERMKLTGLAAHFATAEHMVTEGLTCTFTSSSNGISDFYETGFGNNNYRKLLNYDIHSTGSHLALMAYTKIFKGYSTCLHELIVKLKAKSSGSSNLFDKSLITLTGDFNRSGRADGSGADHGSDGTNYTIFSGKVPKLTVIGNTTEYAPGESPKWSGSWGVAAPMSQLGGRKIGIRNVASTVCTILGQPSITANDASLVRLQNDKVYSLSGKPENIKAVA